MRLAFAAACALGLGLGFGSAAACTPRFVGDSATWAIGAYDPLAASGVTATFSVTIRNEGASACATSAQRVRLGLAAAAGAGALRNASSALTYQIAADHLATNPVNAGLSSATYALAAGAEQTFTHTLTLPAAQFGVAGDYADSLVYLLTNSAGVEQDRLIVSVSAFLPSIAFMRASGATGAGPVQIDLGELVTGASNADAPVLLRFLATSRFRMTVRSENGGVLLHETAARQSIPYTIAIGADVFDLSGGAGAVIGQASQSAFGESRNVIVTVGEVEDRRAGLYTDRVIVTVEPI